MNDSTWAKVCRQIYEFKVFLWDVLQLIFHDSVAQVSKFVFCVAVWVITIKSKCLIFFLKFPFVNQWRNSYVYFQVSIFYFLFACGKGQLCQNVKKSPIVFSKTESVLNEAQETFSVSFVSSIHPVDSVKMLLPKMSKFLKNIFFSIAIVSIALLIMFFYPIFVNFLKYLVKTCERLLRFFLKLVWNTASYNHTFKKLRFQLE